MSKYAVTMYDDEGEEFDEWEVHSSESAAKYMHEVLGNYPECERAILVIDDDKAFDVQRVVTFTELPQEQLLLEASYDEGGWDYLVECYTDQEIVDDFMKGTTTYSEFFKEAEYAMNTKGEYRWDIQQA